MERINAWRKLTTVALVMAMTVSAMAGIGPARAKEKTESIKTQSVRHVKSEDVAKSVSDKPEQNYDSKSDATYDPTVDSYDAYTVRDCAQIFEAGKMTVSVKDDKITVDEAEQGIRIKAKPVDIEQGEITFSQAFDFSNYKPGFVIVNALSERKKPAKVSIYLDNETTPLGTISVPRQRGKDKWDYRKNYSVNISGKNITGKHTVRLKFSFDTMSAEQKKDKAELLLRGVLFTAFDIPTVNVNIDENDGTIAEMNNDPVHNTECYGNIKIETPSGYVSEYGGKDCSGTYELEYIRGRGNSTWGPSKRPYRIKLDNKADFFGMGADKNWVLLANYYDYTLLRNKYTYWLGDKMGMEFTPQCVFVNLVMNGEYLGSYYLCEHVRVGKSRVNIDNLEDEPGAVSGSAVTGGYLLSTGYEEGDYRNLATMKGMNFLLERPDFGDNTPVPEQFYYISDYVQKTEDAIFGKKFKDADGVSYTDYMDLQSTVDFYLIQEFSLNGDGYVGGSNYLYKKRDGKLFWGPLWDFDYVAWGATEFYGNQTDGFIHANNAWIGRLLQDEVFKAKLKERWKVLKDLLEQSIADGGEIDKLSKQQYMSQKANYFVAATLADSEYSYDAETGGKIYVNYDSEIARLKDWIRSRIQYVDQHIGDAITPSGVTVTFKVGKKVYARVNLNNNMLEAEQIPTEPKKKGYQFKGWYAKDKKGHEYEVLGLEFTSNVTAYARWIKKDKVKNGPKIFFPYSECYITDDAAHEYYIPFGSYPDKVSVDKIKWSCNRDNVLVHEGVLSAPEGYRGVVTVTAKYKKTTIKCKIYITKWENLKMLRTLSFSKKNITMTKGTYKVLKVAPSPKEVNAFAYQNGFNFCSQNEKVVHVGPDGVLHALKKGKSVIAASIDGKMFFCTVTVKAAKKNTKKNGKKTIKKTVKKKKK